MSSDPLKDRGYALRGKFFSEEELLVLEEALRGARPRFPTTLNKSGLIFSEFLFFHSKPLQSFASSQKIVDLLKRYIGNDFWLRKDQTVTKFPGGEEFPWHQDNAYNSLRDPYFQFWIALTDMNPENGGLRLLPASHLQGIRPHKLVDNHLAWQGNPENEVAVNASRGDVLIFSSLLLHRSGPNRTDKDRRAYVLEFMSSDHFDPYTRPPYFQVAKNGRPDPKFVRFYKGNLSASNQLYYAVPRFKRKMWLIETALRRNAKRLLGKI